MRRKDTISVVFEVHELSSWKTEKLYVKMMDHPRFSPILLVLPAKDNIHEISNVELYMQKNHYTYYMLKQDETIQKRFHPDIIFYQKPYGHCLDKRFFYKNNLRSLFCYMSYCFRNTILDFNQNTFFHNIAWQIYVENQITKLELASFMDNSAKNTIVTGLTIMDDLLNKKIRYKDPWKQLGCLKRIIYAPHHTIGNEIVNRSTFLKYADFMIEMAEKYKDQVQWAFKPHPLLEEKLRKLWGDKKTDDYYKKWAKLENAQLEKGPYLGLFHYSDAMIHDSGSFILEYLYTGKPVMYLFSDNPTDGITTKQTELALNVHYRGNSFIDIERFIGDIISGKDKKCKEREAFVSKNLMPPYGISVCDNVIKSILGC